MSFASCSKKPVSEFCFMPFSSIMASGSLSSSTITANTFFAEALEITPFSTCSIKEVRCSGVRAVSSIDFPVSLVYFAISARIQLLMLLGLQVPSATQASNVLEREMSSAISVASVWERPKSKTYRCSFTFGNSGILSFSA